MSEDKEALRKEWESVFKQWPPSMWSDESFDWFYTKLKNQAEECGSVMIAAAEEIQEHWQAHCDEDGYGPANLMHRLEHGIAAYYPGYSFGSFTKMQNELDQLKAELQDYKKWFSDEQARADKLGDELNALKSSITQEKEKAFDEACDIIEKMYEVATPENPYRQDK